MGQVLTMGDALNDLEMIVDAGHGVAMTTAPDEVQAPGALPRPARGGRRRRRPDRGAGARAAGRRAPQRGAPRGRGEVHPGGARRARRAAVTAEPERRSRALGRAPGSCPTATRRGPRPSALLRAGGIVAVPTDTVYGIAADIALPDAIERLFAAKRRPPERAVAVLLADVDQACDAGAPVARRPRSSASGSGPAG